MMTQNELLKQVFEEYKENRLKNEQEESNRLAEVSKRCPEITLLIEERRNDILQSIQNLVSGKAVVGLEERTLKRNAEIRKLLKTNAFPEDYLEPVYSCPLCEDTGHPRANPGILCACVHKRLSQITSSAWNTKENPSFENFDENIFPAQTLEAYGISQRQYMVRVKKTCEHYAERISDSSPLVLLFYGPSGLGKSYLMRCINRRACERGLDSLYLTANTLLNRIRQSYFSREENEESEPYYEIPLLLIDDLGTEPLWENITIEQLFALIDSRINAGLHTVISTNLLKGELKTRYTERLSSRLFDLNNSLLIEFFGQDLRLLKHS